MEIKLIQDLLVLFLPDGNKREVYGGGELLVRLLCGVCPGTDFGTGLRE